MTTNALFPTIGSTEARRYIAIGRSTPNQVRALIAAQITLRGGAAGEPGGEGLPTWEFSERRPAPHPSCARGSHFAPVASQHHMHTGNVRAVGERPTARNIFA